MKHSEFWKDKMNRESSDTRYYKSRFWFPRKEEMIRTHDVHSFMCRKWSHLIIRAFKLSFYFLQSFEKRAVNIPSARVPPEKWTILMQIIEQMLSKELLSYSFKQWFVIAMLSKYSAYEAKKEGTMLVKEGFNSYDKKKCKFLINTHVCKFHLHPVLWIVIV